MGKKNIFMLIGAFVVGGLVVGALAYGSGAVLQGRLMPGQNPFLPADKQPCKVTVCQVWDELQTDHKNRQKDVDALVQRLSAAEARIEMVHNSNISQYSDMAANAAKITAVENRATYLESALNNLAGYTYSRFTEASDKFVQLGVGGLSK